MERLVLGTAQLGMNYGIANRSGQPDAKTAEAIIKTAWDFGICEFDTAQAYGESEGILGEVLHSLGICSEVKIISKFHPNLDHLNENDLIRALERTLSNLRILRLHGIMVHREEFLDSWDQGLGEILSRFVRSGLVEHLGVSVYSPNKAMQALNTEGVSIVQLPSNVLDQRFENAGIFKLAKDMGKQIYVRSIFLQGLIIMDNKDIPARMEFAFPVLKKFEALTQEIGLSKKDLALGYAKEAYPDAKIVFGVETPAQLKDNLSIWDRTLPFGLVERVQREFKDVQDNILNPAVWPNQ